MVTDSLQIFILKSYDFKRKTDTYWVPSALSGIQICYNYAFKDLFESQVHHHDKFLTKERIERMRRSTARADFLLINESSEKVIKSERFHFR